MGVKHTPGPWLTTGGHHRYWVSADTRDDIACIPIDDVDMDTLAECEANARLIAAAPELIFACRAALVAWGHKVMVDGYEHDALKLIRAAIAKAEGGDA